MSYRHLLISSFVLVSLSYTPATAQKSEDEDIAKLELAVFSCADYVGLVEADDGRSEVVTVWAHGFHTSHRSLEKNSDPITWRTVADFAVKLKSACEKAPSSLWIEALRKMK